LSGALDVSLDVSAVPSQPVGVGRFALDLVSALVARADVSLTLWCRRTDSRRWERPCAPPGFAPTLRAVAPEPRPLRLAWEQLALGRLVDRCGVSVHHGPHYTMPERARVPCVVTVHDLTFFEHPEWHQRSKVRVFRRAITVAARRARVVVCDSEHTAERLGALCPPAGRVFVVPLGVDLSRFTATAGPSDTELREALGVRGPYVLFLGTLEPRKAVPELVAAFDTIAPRFPDLSLVLAGRPGWGTAAIDRAIAAARHAERILRTGYVPDDAVAALLRGASAVAYPAKEEGFGLPALEALACGAPLVTTAGTVMAEVAGSAATTVRAGSVDELADALEAVVGGDGVADRRRTGLAVAASYTWERCAQGHRDAYEWAASSG
jgi:glycosyltransferase involved in cell wall biosynthesis